MFPKLMLLILPLLACQLWLTLYYIKLMSLLGMTMILAKNNKSRLSL